ncbi:MAG: glycosyltransferase family 9 protein [Acidobacteriota bacterium]|nr:glycosyltransferase family 9 protein [Acidobacteriota bacterium]
MRPSPGILIIRLSSLGDILHTLPAFAGLTAAYPDSRIDWLVAEKCRFLVSAIRGVDTIHVLDTSRLLRFPPDRDAWRRLRRLIRDLRNSHYDYSFDFQGLIKTSVLGFLAGSRERLGFSRELAREFPAHWLYTRTLAKPQNPVHVVQLNRSLAGLPGPLPDAAVPDFIVPDDDAVRVNALLKKQQLTDFVVINPGGGWGTKRWSQEKYGSLAKRIYFELGLQVAVTTGPGEDSYYSVIAKHCERYIPHHFPVSFLQLIPLFKKARLVIGGDTGPFHLACALGIPVVGIFGPTSPLRNGPWTGNDEVVAHTLPCSFCYGRSCGTGNECMDIPVDEVFAAVERRLAHIGRSPDGTH